MAREATVLAFNDVFGLLARLAGGVAVLVALSILYRRWRHEPHQVKASA
jgi:hypothetical protein